MEAFPRLNADFPLVDRLAAALDGSVRLDIAVAYAKLTGVRALLEVGIPARTRVIAGTGFGLTEPDAVEALAEAGASVRVFVGSELVPASGFHPKLYLIVNSGKLLVLAGSANLTGGGLAANVEQYEEIRMPLASSEADAHARRFHHIWELGLDLDDLVRAGAWDVYKDWATRRREQDRVDRLGERDRTEEILRRTGAASRRQSPASRTAQPGYMAITTPAWWDRQLTQWPAAGEPIFWRRRSDAFSILEAGGLFFHILNRGGQPADDRTVEGVSRYTGTYEVMTGRDAWRRHGIRLGVGSEQEMEARLAVVADDPIGLIHLEQPRAFSQGPTLGDLRAAGVPFERQTVSGRGLRQDEIDTILQLGEHAD